MFEYEWIDSFGGSVKVKVTTDKGTVTIDVLELIDAFKNARKDIDEGEDMLYLLESFADFNDDDDDEDDDENEEYDNAIAEEDKRIDEEEERMKQCNDAKKNDEKDAKDEKEES